jgi:uncharacterized transporter YbjL
MTVSDSNGLALVAIAIGLAAVALVWFRGRRSRTSLALAVVSGATASSPALSPSNEAFSRAPIFSRRSRNIRFPTITS